MPRRADSIFPDVRRAKLFLNGEAIANDDARLPKDWYSTDLWTTFGLKFIDEALAAKKPFFLYLCHNAPHFPLQAPAEEIAKFRGKYKAGWDALREQRHERQIELGIIDAGVADAPRPHADQGVERADPAEEQDRFDHLMAVYAAPCHRMDRAVGDLVAGLEAARRARQHADPFHERQRRQRRGRSGGQIDGDPTKADSDWFCGESWAFLQNTPFRRYKHYNHEGGIATPLIAHWPAGIAAKGELRKQPAHLIDIMATCVDVAGATYPEEFDGKPILPMEGRSFAPAFANQPIERDALFWEHEGNAAVRVGDMKLVRAGRNNAWELYDMKSDRTEQENLAGNKPEMVKALLSKWDEWAIRAHVKPYPGEANGKKGGAKKKAKQ